MIKSERGFTLIEIMVAVVIISFSFISLMAVFPLSLKIVRYAENRTRASYYAQEKIEELFQTGYSAIGTGTIEPRASLGTEAPRSGFERETAVELLDGDLNASAVDLGIKKISCIVYFTNPFKNTDESFQSSTIIISQ